VSKHAVGPAPIGDPPGGCKKVTFHATWTDPMNRTWGFKSVTTHEGPDKEVFEAWNILPAEMPVPEGASREHKAMEITYTRKK
jgi:hypothetical protein